MDYVRSDKGGMKLLFQNNLYLKQKVLSSEAVCWQCDRLLWGYIHWKTSSWWTSQSTVIWSGSWNMYDQTIGDLPRTNNAAESWHWRFQANVGAYHPNFWKFIDILKRERSLNHVNISQARAGHQPEPQRRRYQDSNRRIKNIVQDYHNRDRLQYLRGLAHNISMWRNGFFKNHKTTGFMPPKTVLLRTTNLPWGYANHSLLYRPMPYVFYC